MGAAAAESRGLQRAAPPERRIFVAQPPRRFRQPLFRQQPFFRARRFAFVPDFVGLKGFVLHQPILGRHPFFRR